MTWAGIEGESPCSVHRNALHEFSENYADAMYDRQVRPHRTVCEPSRRFVHPPELSLVRRTTQLDFEDTILPEQWTLHEKRQDCSPESVPRLRVTPRHRTRAWVLIPLWRIPRVQYRLPSSVPAMRTQPQPHAVCEGSLRISCKPTRQQDTQGCEALAA